MRAFNLVMTKEILYVAFKVDTKMFVQRMLVTLADSFHPWFAAQFGNTSKTNTLKHNKQAFKLTYFCNRFCDLWFLFSPLFSLKV